MLANWLVDRSADWKVPVMADWMVDEKDLTKAEHLVVS